MTKATSRHTLDRRSWCEAPTTLRDAAEKKLKQERRRATHGCRQGTRYAQLLTEGGKAFSAWPPWCSDIAAAEHLIQSTSGGISDHHRPIQRPGSGSAEANGVRELGKVLAPDGLLCLLQELLLRDMELDRFGAE